MTFDSIVDDAIKARASYETTIRDLLTNGFRLLFEKYPELDHITWNQFTPYFNDGDSCTFGVGDPSFYLVGEEPEDKYDESFFACYRGKSYDKSYNKIVDDQKLAAIGDDIGTLFKALDEDAFHDAYGDHQSVTVTREGSNTDEYCHD